MSSRARVLQISFEIIIITVVNTNVITVVISSAWSMPASALTNVSTRAPAPTRSPPTHPPTPTPISHPFGILLVSFHSVMRAMNSTLAKSSGRSLKPDGSTHTDKYYHRFFLPLCTVCFLCAAHPIWIGNLLSAPYCTHNAMTYRNPSFSYKIKSHTLLVYHYVCMFSFFLFLLPSLHLLSFLFHVCFVCCFCCCFFGCVCIYII